ncbi:transglycosylase SLT domain-containing protein [Kitasatospora sp. NPDC002040]|uniref:aggregation-promoting factor C-terminal-like domain-containing protein n=1 Tax=Kitasatospora sp. NPDC002040 TaxID=3154661 RepID=UPI003325FB9E
MRSSLLAVMRRRTTLMVASAGLATACAASAVAVALPEENAVAAPVAVAVGTPAPAVAVEQPAVAAVEQPAVQPKQEEESPAVASRSEQRSELSAATVGTSPSAVRELARSIVPAAQYAAFSRIISHESGWNFKATNASSGAYGLAQALPGSKMASAGADWRTNPATQIKWALDYMNSRYGSPNAAWSFWQSHHWY